jgi:acetyltransferase-like isoleucine patch superfamily enzyme
MSILNKVIRLFRALAYFSTSYLYYKMIFKSVGTRARIKRPLQLMGTDNISIGDKVVIGKFGWLASDNRFGAGHGEILIGNHTYIGNFAHIYSTGSIIIGQHVLIADKVYISDNAHGYEDITKAITDQEVKQLNHVTIGDNSWIGENACIIGVSIGKHAIVGANSVVNKDVPDYTIVGGVPAKPIKRYDFDLKIWRRVNEKGEFI